MIWHVRHREGKKWQELENERFLKEEEEKKETRYFFSTNPYKMGTMLEEDKICIYTAVTYTIHKEGYVLRELQHVSI